MPRHLARCLAVLPLALALTACVSFRPPATGMDSLEAQRKEVQPPTGYLAITGGFDLNSLATYQPHVTLDLKSKTSGEPLRLRISDKEMMAFGKNVEQVPLVFVVPPGEWEMVASHMHIPGGHMNGREYESVDQDLGIEKQVQPFKIETDALTHLAVVKLSLKDVLKGTVRFFYCETLVTLEKPAETVWKPYAPLLAKTPATYAKKTQINTYVWPKLAWSKDATPAATAEKGTRKTLSKSQIQATTKPAFKTAEACHLKLAPRARGKVNVEYIIAPEGAVHEANVTKSTLGHPATEKCILEAFKALKFPRPPEDDYETWTAAIEF